MTSFPYRNLGYFPKDYMVFVCKVKHRGAVLDSKQEQKER